MPFYRDRIYPHLVRVLGDPPPIRKVRQQIVPWARGKVLEIGVGSRLNPTRAWSGSPTGNHAERH